LIAVNDHWTEWELNPPQDVCKTSSPPRNMPALKHSPEMRITNKLGVAG
jgi:hypothetical protein